MGVRDGCLSLLLYRPCAMTFFRNQKSLSEIFLPPVTFTSDKKLLNFKLSFTGKNSYTLFYRH